MIPFCTDTVTHYHYAGRDTWTRNVLRGVHWRYGTTNSAYQSSDGRIERVPQTRIIIPHSLMPDISIDTGGRDYFVLGDAVEYTAPYARRLYYNTGGIDARGRRYGPARFKNTTDVFSESARRDWQKRSAYAILNTNKTPIQELIRK